MQRYRSAIIVALATLALLAIAEVGASALCVLAAVGIAATWASADRVHLRECFFNAKNIETWWKRQLAVYGFNKKISSFLHHEAALLKRRVDLIAGCAIAALLILAAII